MKKTLLLILSSILSVSALSARDFDYTYEGQTLTYTVLDETAKTCTTKEGTVSDAGNNVSGDLIIPDKVYDGTDEYTVTSIGNYAFINCRGLLSIKISESVTSIGDDAFRSCNSLPSIKIPESVTSIGDGAFSGCHMYRAEFASIESLCSIKFGGATGNPLSCAHRLYINNKEITDLVIPESVTSIGSKAFWDCSSLTSVTIPESVISIGVQAFYWCNNITEVIYLSKQPCTAFASLFSESVYENATLRIPQGTLSIYKETAPWNKFINISDEPLLSGIEDVVADADNAIDYSQPYDVYNLQGIRVASSTSDLLPDLYIIRQGAKVAKKAIR